MVSGGGACAGTDHGREKTRTESGKGGKVKGDEGRKEVDWALWQLRGCCTTVVVACVQLQHDGCGGQARQATQKEGHRAVSHGIIATDFAFGETAIVRW